MGPREKKKVNDRVNNLRDRLSSTCNLLGPLSRKIGVHDGEAREDICLVILAIQTVVDDLASVCRDHLSEAADASQRLTAARTDFESATDAEVIIERIAVSRGPAD